MITVTRALPCAPLAPFVRYFQDRRGSTRHAPIRYPIAARPEQFVEFYMRDRQEIVACGHGRGTRSPSLVLVGPQCGPGADLLVDGDYEVFTIHFQPAGLSRMFGVRLSDYTNRGDDAGDLLGRDWRVLHDALRAVPDLAARKRVAETFLLRRLEAAAEFHPVHDVAVAVLGRAADLDVATLAERCNLGIRQFERRFEAAIGVTPKLFQRIVRFSRVLRGKSAEPGRSFTQLAHETGYHDHMHLVRDFKLLAGYAPTDFFARRGAACRWSPVEGAPPPR